MNIPFTIVRVPADKVASARLTTKVPRWWRWCRLGAFVLLVSWTIMWLPYQLRVFKEGTFREHETMVELGTALTVLAGTAALFLFALVPVPTRSGAQG